MSLNGPLSYPNVVEQLEIKSTDPLNHLDIHKDILTIETVCGLYMLIMESVLCSNLQH